MRRFECDHCHEHFKCIPPTLIVDDAGDLFLFCSFEHLRKFVNNLKDGD